MCYVYRVVNARPKLVNARRESLKLSLRAAGRLADPPISGVMVHRFEHNGPATLALLALCRGYMREARRRGYDAWGFHESALCPRDKFPAPVRQDDAELERILGPAGNGQAVSPETAGVAR